MSRGPARATLRSNPDKALGVGVFRCLDTNVFSMAEFVDLNPTVSRFPLLVESRREWIDQVLVPWCRTASRRDLLQAEQSWVDLAGRPDPEKSLWLWAWQRFPVLNEDGLSAINETWLVQVMLLTGESRTGYPDARLSLRGELILISIDGQELPPCQIDSIASVSRIEIF